MTADYQIAIVHRTDGSREVELYRDGALSTSRVPFWYQDAADREAALQKGRHPTAVIVHVDENGQAAQS